MSFPLDLIGELFGGRLVAERAELDSPTGGQTTLIYLDDFNLDRRYALLDHVDRLRRAVGKIQDPSVDKRAPVVDHHHHAAPVIGVGDPQHGAEGKMFDGLQ